MKTRLWGGLLALALVGCPKDEPVDSSDSEPRETGAPPPDQDGDGWSAPQDCDDGDPLVHPDGEETCATATDDDCDGSNNDLDALGCVPYAADSDGDGYGVEGQAACTCFPSGLYSATTTGDCNDAREDISPQAAEACNGLDDDCDALVDEEGAGTPWYRDGDGDLYGDPSDVIYACAAPEGYVAEGAGFDCDDTNPVVSPANSEVCDPDNVDEDCDGLADDADDSACPCGMVPFYADVDGDGYGDEATLPVSLCDPSGVLTASTATDCDDTDYTVFPSAPERCNGVDDDCNAVVDDHGALEERPWYQDADRDSYGNGAISLVSCDAPMDYVEDGTDCDDGNPARNPGAPEVCDAVDLDEDCDLLADDGDPDVAGRVSFFPDLDGDGYGDMESTGQERCDPDATYEVTDNTDCNDGTASAYPGATERCDSADLDEDCDGLSDDDDPSTCTCGKAYHYPDADDDGYGDEKSSGNKQCDPTEAWATTNHSDCDDGDALILPGGLEEDDSVDNDCDDVVDEGFRLAGDLVVTEVLYAPTLAPDGQWFEIFNPGDRDLYLAGLYVGTATTSGGSSWFYVAPDGLVVGAGETAVVCQDMEHVSDLWGTLCDYAWGEDVNGASSAGATWNGSFQLGDTGDGWLELSLGGVQLDRVDWDVAAPWPVDAAGASIELSLTRMDATSNDEGANWCRALDPWAEGSDLGTPDAPNACAR